MGAREGALAWSLTTGDSTPKPAPRGNLMKAGIPNAALEDTGDFKGTGGTVDPVPPN
eukprot:CAMPEP_0181181636 /NCGR_PEP_ID=MMETSP1096-20121128/7444_1 /TAXON_ID=156174 ORGANISM="Chrysochromulina ericina, Strain CCMP281" /NCGR_SAMPLE_ID=MMETSP1096 /ASSEMBLY_ACC=CAM_ASM_000453 /LENGTH=56 /DNA_ID=CAMNT_0023270155 /DNA_START=959 /DNA_END=1129 /DNA_ORIENTATION=-